MFYTLVFEILFVDSYRNSSGKFVGEAVMRRCRICTHERRNEIESALTSGRTYQDITRLFGVSKQSIGTHKRCISNALQLFESRQIRQSRQVVTEALKPRVYLSAIEKQRFIQSSILSDLSGATSIAEKSLLYRNFLTSCDNENKLFGNYSPEKQHANREKQTELEHYFNRVWGLWCTLPLHDATIKHNEESFLMLLAKFNQAKGKVFDDCETGFFRAMFENYSKSFLPKTHQVLIDISKENETAGNG
jgi:uncharacterized protein YerC